MSFNQWITLIDLRPKILRSCLFHCHGSRLELSARIDMLLETNQ